MSRISTAFPLVTSLFLLLGVCSNPPSEKELATRSPAAGGVIVHLFEWRWDDVAIECEEVLGPAGFSAVQISPPSENHVIGGRPWYERYQPVSYQLETRSGSREQFADMVSRCAAAGVDIIADAVINHMTDADLQHETLQFSSKGTAGTRFSSFSYPGLYEYDDFNHCGLTANDDIVDWEDATQLRECELVDLADLDTRSSSVRSTLASYIRDLASLGVRGIRIDAAKHMYAEDIAAILEEAEFSGYVVQEVSQGPIDRRVYYANGDITVFDYGYDIHNAFKSGNLASLNGDASRWSVYDPSDVAFLFVDNHDTQRNPGVLSYRDAAMYELAQVFTLAWPFGRVRVMSSFESEGHENSPPSFADETIKPVYGDDGDQCGQGEWVCEHRWPGISGAVAFRNATADYPVVTNWWTNGSDQIAFGRGEAGFVAINASSGPMSAELNTSLSAGTYCNRVFSEDCHEIGVDPSGIVSLELGPMEAVVVDHMSLKD